MVKKIKKGIKVKVITGDDKGRTGEVLSVLPKKSLVKVKGVSLIKKHVKPTQDKPGSIVTIESYINISNVTSAE